MKYYYIYTYGCQMNVHESEKLAGILENKGYKNAKLAEEADVIVFNTCCIRESAEQKIMGNIGAIKPLKKKNKDKIVALCGCMTQQSNMANTLKQKFPFIDIIFGANNIEFFGEYLEQYLKQRKFLKEIKENQSYIDNNMPPPLVRDNPLYAYVNIMYGCNNFCSYCIVPYVKGRERSVPPQKIYSEIKTLLELGYKVITLLGQNVNSYGNDNETDGVTFAQLLDNICKFEYDFELRFMSSHPKDLSDDVIDVISKNCKISRAIHLPIQSGSNKILKLMNRNYTREQYLDLIKKIRYKIPNVSLSTDIIVGFPDETDEDYQDTINLIKEVKYSNAYIFMYSKRSGTPAAKMENQIPLSVKRERINNLLKLEKQISKEFFNGLVGTTQRALIEKEEDKAFIAKIQCGKVVLIEKTEGLKIGDFIDIKISDYKKGNLIGEQINGTKQAIFRDDE